VFHTRTPGSRRSPRHDSRRSHAPARPEEGPSFEPDPVSNPGIGMMRREARRAVSELDRRDGGRLALTLVGVMEDGTTNLLGATRAAGDLGAEVAADMVSGSRAGQSAAWSAGEASGPPLGSWLERLGGRYFWVAPEAFFQVNTPAAELLLAEVSAHV